jgi:peptidoglycan/xylan/chitin deacetylase (PgdA/CDA1 family)
MYHDVVEHLGRDAVYFDVTKEQFAEQMRELADQGYSAISLDQLYKHLTQGAPVPPKAVVITFDDNYQGFYDNALPVLKQYNFPAAMFVHTGFVGDKEHGRPKMDWTTLQELVKGGLVTIGSHTVTHPADITVLSRLDQQQEVENSKKALEDHLGIKINFIAYPDGKNDIVTREVTRAAGYLMAFGTDHGLAEQSQDLFNIHRYISTKLEDALQESTAAMDAPAAIFRANLKTDDQVSLTAADYGGVKIAFVKGGSPVSWKDLEGREPVGDFVRDANGVAGINGGFFAEAAIKSNDNEMVGPSQAETDNLFRPDFNDARILKLLNRPLVMWNEKEIAVVPFQVTMDDQPSLNAFMPGLKDLFVAGAWLVHEGVARTRDQMDLFGSKDIQDPRKRAFMGVDFDGRFVIGASLSVTSSADLATALATAGVREAVLLDSGFSTSLIYDSKVIATGHTAPDLPSRPVPHAIVLRGQLAPTVDDQTNAILQAAEAQDLAEQSRPRRRHHRKAAETAMPDNNNAPPDVAGPPVPPPDTSSNTPPPEGSGSENGQRPRRR